MESIKLEIDDKKFVGYLESWLEDFQEVSRTFGKTLNADRVATLKIPDGELFKIKKLQQSLEKLSERKFFIENTPDFSAITSSLKDVNESLKGFRIPESIKIDPADIKISTDNKPIDLTPLKEAILRLEFSLKEGLRISNLNEIPIVLSKGSSSGTSSGTGDASEASLQSIIAQLVALNATVSGTLDVSVTSSALPSGASTEAKQDTQITAEQAIQAAIGATADAIVAAGAAGSLSAKLRRISQGLEDLKTLIVLGAGDNNIGNVDIASIAAGDNNIGNVDVVTVPTDPFGATADAIVAAGATGSISAKLRRITQGLEDLKSLIVLGAGTNTIGKLAANSGVDIGDVTLTAGSAAIGKLAANSGVDIGDVTLTAGAAAVGSILPPDTDVTAHTNYAKKYYTNAGAVTDGIIWSPAAGKRWHVHALYIQVSAAATVTLEDDKAGGDEVVWKSELAANSGAFLVFPEHYPLASGEDAADLIITTSAGNVYVTVVGYEI